ncbi:MAG: hypothetical protein V1735_07690 [Nanoarchaeota archaeon]
MYQEFETKTSYKYLKEVISNLKEPICILGGWAVFFHVNNRFDKSQGRPYLGSRDIDLGFSASSNTLPQTIKTLEKLKFKPLSFRMLKEIHTETEEEIPTGERVPAHFIFPMYVDLIVDTIPNDFKKAFGFNPIDEPLLKHVFENNEGTQMKEFDRKLLLPSPELLLAMKINSLPMRDKEHKRIKDLCDIFALTWYTDLKPESIDPHKFISQSAIHKCKKTIHTDDYSKASEQLGHSPEEVKRIIESVLG